MARPVRAAALLPVLVLAGCTAPPPDVPADTLPRDLPLDVVPLGLSAHPSGNDSLTPARVNLGRRLFFDPILSADNTVACASCHQPNHGFASPEGRPRGITGRRTTRRAPTLLNRAYGTSFFWDGRAASLEAQALEPIANPEEMGSSVAAAVDRLKEDSRFQAEFSAVFNDGVTAENLGRALASFERVLLRGDSPVDRFRQRGEHDALTTAERHGLWLYESKAGCWRCHGGPNFTDERFHNTGIGWGRVPEDGGRQMATKDAADRGKFKSPTLRGVRLTAPYMHDGSVKTLQEVVEFYNRGGNPNPNLDAAMTPLRLSADEITALIAFLNAL